MSRLVEYFGLSRPANPAPPTLFDVKRAAAQLRRNGTSIMQLGIVAAIPALIVLLRLLSLVVTRRFGASSVGAGTFVGAFCLALACGGIPLGVALRRHREWAREMLVELGWLVAAAAAAAPFAFLFLAWTRRPLDRAAWMLVGLGAVLAAVVVLSSLRRIAWLKSPVVLAVFAPDTPAAEETLSTLGKDAAAERAAWWRALSKRMREGPASRPPSWAALWSACLWGRLGSDLP